MFFTKMSIKKPTLVWVLFAVLVLAGGLSYQKLNVNDMPQIDIPYATVSVVETGASPKQIESNVTKPIEDAMSQISGVKHVSSSISEGISVTTVEFGMNMESSEVTDLVKDKLSTIRGDLPKDIEEPLVNKVDVSEETIMSLALVGGEVDALSKQAEKVKDKLLKVDGVGRVNLSGQVDRAMMIYLDKNKLAAYEITASDIVAALSQDNFEASSGKVIDHLSESAIHFNSVMNSESDFEQLAVQNHQGNAIKLGEVATIRDGYKKHESLYDFEGRPAVEIDLVKQSGANTLQTAKNVEFSIEDIQKDLPENMRIEMVRDSSKSTEQSLDGVMMTIRDGCLLAVLIVLLFLGKWESTLISAISLPVSMITTFIAIKYMHFSLNTMSLMALSLSVGLLVDDAIVVIENINRHIELGKKPLEAAIEATSEIGSAVVATTLAVVAVFLPVSMVSGFIGKVFMEFGLTVVFSMLISLVVSFTLVPMIASRLLKRKSEGEEVKHLLFMKFDELYLRTANGYRSLLRVALKHKWKTVLLATGLFWSSIALMPLLGFSFLPTSDLGEIYILAKPDAYLSMEGVSQKAELIEAAVRTDKAVISLSTNISKDQIQVYAKLKDKSERKVSDKAVVARLRSTLNEVTGAEISLSTSQEKDVAINLKGDNLEALGEFALEIKHDMENDPAAKDVAVSFSDGSVETVYTANRSKMKTFNVSPEAVSTTLLALYGGTDIGKYTNENERYDVHLELNERSHSAQPDDIFVSNSAGQLLPITKVLDQSKRVAAQSLERKDKSEIVTVTANVMGESADTFTEKYLKKIKERGLPNGVSIENVDDMGEGFADLVIALGMGILCIFLVMAAQFESFIDPIAIMFALPMAMIGAIVELFITGGQMSVMSLIGIIMLMGVVSKNGILLVDFAKREIGLGKNRDEALIEAGYIKLRPILMTSFAMIFGMLPSVLSKATGAEIYAPMAHAIIGGLISSTLLTLFIVPVVYAILGETREKISPKVSQLKHLFVS